MNFLPLLIGIAMSVALISAGGGIYEHTLIDPVWPEQLALIRQPKGIKRVRFWAPVHILFELSLIASLWYSWASLDIRQWLLIAFGSHAVLRLWSAFYFIPKAIVFEKADPASFEIHDARRWVTLSLLRLPLSLITSVSMVLAFSKAIVP